MMYFDVTGLKGVYHQPHQQPKCSQWAYFYLFVHVCDVHTDV